MLDEARRLSEAALAAGVLRYERMDAESLDFADSSFDVVLSLCAVLHFPNIDTAIAEMRRVLRPGGRLVIGFGAGRPATLLPLAQYTVKRAVALARAHGRPELRGPNLLFRLASELLPDPDQPALVGWPAVRGPLPRLRESLRSAGFSSPRVSWIAHEVRYESAKDFWDAQTAIVTEVRSRIGSADSMSVERLRHRFELEAERVLSQGGRLVYPYGATVLRTEK